MSNESQQQEWTPEYVGSLVGETFNGAWVIAAAHNAELAAERERFDTLQRQAGELHSRAHRAEQQLLSAQAAIEKQRQIVIGRLEVELNATDRNVYGCLLTNLDHKNFIAINPDLSLLHQHDAEVRKPLMDLLREAHERLGNTAFPSLAKRIADALSKVKEGNEKKS